ncbi:MAG TPA: thioredoxin family protein [Thermoanaerobaculia bacterium]|nr:thioredoxin family protein [Thermoanaerobaculia bacterium]
MTRVCTTGGFLVLFLLPALAPANPGNQGSTGYDPKRDPAADLREATVVARQAHKRILLVVGGDWCGWCRELATTLHDEGVSRSLAAHYVLLKVNFSPENENRAFLSHYPEITGYPHLLLLDSSGRLLFSDDMDAFERDEGYDCSKLMAFLERWAEGKTPGWVGARRRTSR